MAARSTRTGADDREFAGGESGNLVFECSDGAFFAAVAFSPNSCIIAVIERSTGITGDCCLMTCVQI